MKMLSLQEKNDVLYLEMRSEDIFRRINQYTPVAEWIERCPPEACAAVRLRSGVYS